MISEVERVPEAVAETLAERFIVRMGLAEIKVGYFDCVPEIKM